MEELVYQIIADDELSIEDKKNLVVKIINASHGLDSSVAPGFYLHTDKNGETGELDMQLWYRNVDESGTLSHGPTDYNVDQIMEMIKSGYLNKNKKTK